MSDTKIVFAPFASLMLYEPSLLWLAIKLVMSIAFPLVFALLYRKNVRDDLSLALGWWMLLAGIAQMHLFAESGVRFKDGNFWWSAQIALWLLFIASARQYIRHFKREPRAYIAGAVLALHAVSGVVLLVASMLAEREFQIW